jgi:hypothetical protein
MYLSRGEYTQFSLKGRLGLIMQYGTLVNEKCMEGLTIKIFILYDFYVEVLYNNEVLIKAEPVKYGSMLQYYLD